MTTKPIELKLFGEAETRLDPKPHEGLLTCNPSVELFAIAAGPTSLQIWRSNGQVVAKVSQRGERETVQAIRWKTDGQFLAVGWSDGVVRLMGLESSKAVHQMAVCDPTQSKITCIGWARNNAGKRSNIRENPSIPAWKEVASRKFDPGDMRIAGDLPRDLTFLEIETALPKISPLPISGGSGDDVFVFTTRASLEFLFRPFSPHDSDKVDVMIVGTDDGRIHISIYDSFVVGSFKYALPQSFASPEPLQLVAHSSHPDLSTHTLVFRRSGDSKSKGLYLVPMDLAFIYSSPENLSLLSSKTTTLQKLLRYLKQVQLHMIHEWQATRELPSRFLNSITQTLKEAGTYGEMGIGQALYHSVTTGHTFPEVKEWLVDQLAERGHRRWDKAVVPGLQTLRSLIHENFLPALERIGIILSRLLGIARFHESTDEIGFTSAQITKVADIVSCLILIGHKMLLLVMEELDLFQSFSSWLRQEIDRLASSSSTDELTEQEATMEHGKILTYIQQYMPASPLQHYLSNIASGDADKDWQQAESGTSMLDMLDKQIKQHEAGQEHSGVFSQVEFLCRYLDSKANVVFEGIAEAEKRSVRFGQPVKIQLNGNIAKFDVRMSAAETPGALQGLTYTALTTEREESNVYIFRTRTTIVNGISGAVTAEVTCVSLGSGKVLDLKFLYDDSLLVLWALQGQHLRIVRIPHKANDLGYQSYQPGVAVESHVLSDKDVTSVILNMVLPNDPGFVPVQMEVKEATVARGYIPPRVCLLGSDLQTYKVFALPDDPFTEARKNGEDDVTMQ